MNHVARFFAIRQGLPNGFGRREMEPRPVLNLVDDIEEMSSKFSDDLFFVLYKTP